MIFLKNTERSITELDTLIKKEMTDLVVFSVIHFLVDYCCIFLLTAFLIPLMINRFEWICCLVTYNLFAFAFQLPVGAFGDLYGRPKIIASSGCALIALAYGLLWLIILSGSQSVQGDLVSISGLSSTSSGSVRTRMILFGIAMIAGIGNSFFHVGGGIDTLKKCGGRAGRPGIFVSTGAFGVWLAPVMAARNAGIVIGTISGILLMLFSSLLLFALDWPKQRFPEKIPVSDCSTYETVQEWNSRDSDNTPDVPDTTETILYEEDTDIVESKKPHKGYNNGSVMITIFATGCLFLTILFRSYAGGLLNYSWKALPLLSFLFTLGVSGGKIAGGLLGDRIGWMRSAAGSLLLAFLLFSTASDHPLCGILAIFLFNMTMPVTLTAISRLAGPDREGTAFGLTTFALFLGTLPSSVNLLLEKDLCPSWMLYVLTLLSVLLICAGLAGMQSVFHKEGN